MGQAIVTSRSPHIVIDEFEVTQILAIDRDEKHRLSSTAIPTEGIRSQARAFDEDQRTLEAPNSRLAGVSPASLWGTPWKREPQCFQKAHNSTLIAH